MVEIQLWPDNVLAWQCWLDVQTQWRTGMGGPTGLDYAGVRAYLDEACVGPEQDRPYIWGALREAERAVLRHMSRQREREQRFGR